MATFSVDQVEIFGKGVLQAEGVVIDKDGNVYGGGRNGIMYKVSPDGAVSECATLPEGSIPNGITLDREGCVWVAVPYYRYGESGGYLRLAEGGALRDRIDVSGYSAYACTLGGANGTTLFLCESAVLGQTRRPGDGRIRTVEVDVPGVGTP